MKRSAELRCLSDDHHRALVLAKRAREAVDSHDADKIAAVWVEIGGEWATGLARHFTIEETCLVPPLRAAGGSALASRMEQDHAVVRDLVLSGPHDEMGLLEFAERLSEHVRFEERELFPFAEIKLTQLELGRVAGAHQA